MINKKPLLIIVLFIISTLFSTGISLVSADGWSFSYVQAPHSFNCSAMRVFSTDGTISYSLPKNANISSSEYINGSLYATSSSAIGGNGQHGFPVLSSVFPTAQSYPYVYSVSYTVSVVGEIISQSTLAVRCDSENSATVIANSLDFAGASDEVAGAAAPDARFNWGFGDSNVAIVYPDAAGLSLYLYAGELYIPNFLTAADIEAYVDNPPSENTLVASVGAVTVYILTTGEIQFNMTDAEGKIHVLIMSDLSGNDAYGYSVDPNA